MLQLTVNRTQTVPEALYEAPDSQRSHLVATCLQKLDLTSMARHIITCWAERYRADPRLLFFVLAAGEMAGRALSEHASTSCLRRCVEGE